jgi:hypothetical protein
MPARFGLTEEEFEQRYPNIAKLPPEQKERLIRAITWRTDWYTLLARLDRIDASLEYSDMMHLLCEPEDNAFRIKGVVDVVGEEAPQLVQVVAGRIDVQPTDCPTLAD